MDWGLDGETTIVDTTSISKGRIKERAEPKLIHNGREEYVERGNDCSY